MLDTSFPSQERQWLSDSLKGLYPIVRSFHRVRTRKAGASRFVDMHVVVDPQMSVEESHRIATQIGESIRVHFPGSSAVVHVEPCDGNCDASCLEGCLLSEREQRAIKAAGRVEREFTRE